MNNDLISREALRKAFHERIWYFDKSSWDEANALIDNATTVEAKTTADCIIAYGDGYETARRLYARPQGEWKGNGIERICSDCGFDVPVSKYELCKYCPNCGAKMKKRTKTE